MFTVILMIDPGIKEVFETEDAEECIKEIIDLYADASTLWIVMEDSDDVHSNSSSAEKNNS